MHILLVDNGTSYISQLKRLLSGHAFDVVKYSEISTLDMKPYSAIILSGGHTFAVQGNGDRLKNEINLIKESDKPVFGICFGFEVIAHAYGSKLELMQSKEQGIIDITVVEPDPIFKNLPNFQVFESHRWVVKESSSELIPLARSKDGVEAVKHRSKPIYAVQFHPEMFVEKTCGDEIFFNFLHLIQIYE